MAVIKALTARAVLSLVCRIIELRSGELDDLSLSNQETGQLWLI
jgi:hypothetical protein